MSIEAFHTIQPGHLSQVGQAAAQDLSQQILILRTNSTATVEGRHVILIRREQECVMNVGRWRRGDWGNYMQVNQ